MRDIIIYLQIIYAAAKDLHYTCSGLAFYGQHLMFDSVADSVLSHIDRIKESYFMARDLAVPTGKETFAAAVEKMPDETSADFLLQTITKCIYSIDSAAREIPDLSEGDKTILGDISAELAQKRGFLEQYRKGRL
jgi:DNA-binding ferritin-like protein